jgi:hypothetical protein
MSLFNALEAKEQKQQIDQKHTGKKQKPPKEREDLSEARYRYLLETLSHNLLQKVEVIDCFKSL